MYVLRGEVGRGCGGGESPCRCAPGCWEEEGEGTARGMEESGFDGVSMFVVGVSDETGHSGGFTGLRQLRPELCLDGGGGPGSLTCPTFTVDVGLARARNVRDGVRCGEPALDTAPMQRPKARNKTQIFGNQIGSPRATFLALRSDVDFEPQ